MNTSVAARGLDRCSPNRDRCLVNPYPNHGRPRRAAPTVRTAVSDRRGNQDGCHGFKTTVFACKHACRARAARV